MALSDPLAQQVLRITKLAGDKIMAIYEKDFAIYEKQDTSPLTEADLAAHHVIVDELKAICIASRTSVVIFEDIDNQLVHAANNFIPGVETICIKIRTNEPHYETPP